MKAWFKRFGRKAIEIVLFAGLGLGGAASLSAAPPSLPANAPVRVELNTDGYVMYTPAGNALYFDDAARLQSFATIGACSDKPSIDTDDKESGLGHRLVMGAKYVKACTEKWPPYFADAGAQPVGDFTLVDRSGGKQWAWMGHPLFLSIKDKKPGDRNGSFIPGIYIGAPISNTMRLAILPERLPMRLQLVQREEGLVIASSDGTAIYTPKRGAKPDQRFEPVVAPALAELGGAWSAVSLGADRKQYAFNGKPLYTLTMRTPEADIDPASGWEPVVYVAAPKRPRDIGRHLTLDGEVYTSRDGRTLYTFTCNTSNISGSQVGVTCDDPGDPASSWVALCGNGDECAKRWHPYLAPAGAKPVGLWSVVEVAYPMFKDPLGPLAPPDAPRVKAWAYRGNPLYTYYEDEKPGDIAGDRTWGIWNTGMFVMLHIPGRETSD